MDALLQKETSMIKEKQNNNKKETVTKPNVANKIQDITEHYLKAEEKSDMTALQENETTISHTSKVGLSYLVQCLMVQYLQVPVMLFEKSNLPPCKPHQLPLWTAYHDQT